MSVVPIRLLVGTAIAVAVATANPCPAQGADIPLPGKRLVIESRGGGQSKVVFVLRDGTAGITKGSGTDVDAISATLHIAYGGASNGALFTIPAGTYHGTEGWKSNKEKQARFFNGASPNGSTETQRTTIRPGKSIQFVAKGLGDGVVLDVFGAGAPSGSVFTAYCVGNGGELQLPLQRVPGLRVPADRERHRRAPQVPEAEHR